MAESSDAKTPRERYRAQVQEEIKKHAWEQIAVAGASALSLNAIAKQIGMSGPALYRYFANRDELITELIRDAYRSLADTFHARAAAGADLTGLAQALRQWALEDPQRYFLLYGTPVPGYQAPEDTTRIASEILTVLLATCTAAQSSALRQALAFWTRLHGVLSLELAGHFTGMDVDPAALYTAEAHSLTTQSYPR
ncbi:AcrR family transcriptional regulator [Kitasatospora sp. MAP12-15]|uniref:TetR/AcrR family transcriptional regulator n=1 Tax=unclassified Kitasatospora TaxID=2633591 RepID=UPI0024753F40|nr:TetR/AcrR family transcriptional regulator [Kitasatospora sp. MAP12-44]MDH6112930.1 AcrR family transcriptional regulator [Kitasatospora sp. MAP12-44]